MNIMAEAAMRLITKAYKDVYEGTGDNNMGHRGNIEDGNNLDRLNSGAIEIEEDTVMTIDEAADGIKDKLLEMETNQYNGLTEKVSIKEAVNFPLTEGLVHAEERQREISDSNNAGNICVSEASSSEGAVPHRGRHEGGCQGCN